MPKAPARLVPHTHTSPAASTNALRETELHAGGGSSVLVGAAVVGEAVGVASVGEPVGVASVGESVGETTGGSVGGSLALQKP